MLQRYRPTLIERLKMIFILIAMVLTAACGTHQSAKVSDREQPPSRRIQSQQAQIPQGGTHRVVRGDTLFSIAWRYGLDYRKLAQSNRISVPYTIYPGQVIRLSISPSGSPTVSRSASATAVPVPQRPVQTPPSSSPPNTTALPPRQVPTPSATINRAENRAPAATPSQSSALVLGAPQWQWPTQGRLLSGFQGSTGLNKGIDIAGNLGQPVVAAASGQVVYSGTGLRGYGKLLIIKHNETFLSAYAHNHHLLVKEGDFVKAGQKIADMGSSGTDRVKLHFEIRRDGTPVDPMKYLPKR